MTQHRDILDVSSEDMEPVGEVTAHRAKEVLREQLRESVILASLENLMKYEPEGEFRKLAVRRYLELTDGERHE